MNQKKYLYIIGVLLIAGGLFFYLTKSETSSEASNNLENKSEQKPEQVASDQKNKSSSVNLSKQISSFSEHFKIQSLKSGQVDQNPEKTEQELIAMAQKLSLEEMQTLKNLILTTDAEGDDRSLAAYLLSLNQSPEVLNIIQDTLTAPIANLNEERRNAFEQALRAQVLENLENHPQKNEALKVLNTIADKTESSFLSDRTQRIRSHLMNGTPAIKEQDQKALKKLAH